MASTQASLLMYTMDLEPSELSVSWQELEIHLLDEIRRAEVEFKEAPADQKEQAGERYRRALDRFCELVIDRRFPPEFHVES